jgi:hypothetical protein
VSVTVSETIAVPGQAERDSQVGAGLCVVESLSGGDLGQRGGVTASGIEHARVASRVGGQSYQPVEVAAVGEHMGIAAQQVGRSVGGPALLPVASGPGVQALGEASPGAWTEPVNGLHAQGFVGEKEYPLRGVRVGPAADGAAEHPA